MGAVDIVNIEDDIYISTISTLPDKALDDVTVLQLQVEKLTFSWFMLQHL
jgi:hypothetical protein